MDVHTPEQRSRNMGRVRGRDTKPEILVRRGLHATGLRFRLQARDLPGRPDLVFPRHRAAVLVHGCFWHGHHCPMFKMPATRPEFWAAKIAGNRARDARARQALLEGGWRMLTVWECALRGPGRRQLSEVIEASRDFILGGEPELVLEGAWPSA
jgi:DNA mismatch endonuclease (patch repair protein)